MDSDIELKLQLQQYSDLAIAKRLYSMIDQYSFRSIAEAAGYNTETTRRYLIGESKIPAGFIASVTKHYELDLSEIMFGIKSVHPTVRSLRTDSLINELGRRMALIEDCVVASAATRD